MLLDYLTASKNNYDDDLDDSSSNMPKLIEIDGYRPMMSLIKPDLSIELVQNLDSKTHDKSSLKQQLNLKSGTYLADEFCRFYPLRPFMTWLPPLKSDKHYRLRNNLVYFTQTSITEYTSNRYLNFRI